MRYRLLHTDDGSLVQSEQISNRQDRLAIMSFGFAIFGRMNVLPIHVCRSIIIGAMLVLFYGTLEKLKYVKVWKQ